MMMEYHRMPVSLSELLEELNLILTLCFLGEMVLKHIGLGVKLYWAEPFNRFDGTIVTVSMIDVGITARLILHLPSHNRALNS